MGALTCSSDKHLTLNLGCSLVKISRKAVGHLQPRCSLRECERLKHTPVSGAITWYTVQQDDNGSNVRGDNLYICAPKSGEQVTLAIPEDYPDVPPVVVQGPAGKSISVTFTSSKTLRECVKEVVGQIDAHC